MGSESTFWNKHYQFHGMNIMSFALTLLPLVTRIFKPRPRPTKSGKMEGKKWKVEKIQGFIIASSSPSDLRNFVSEVHILDTLRFNLSTQSFKQLSQFFQLSPHVLGETTVSITYPHFHGENLSKGDKNVM